MSLLLAVGAALSPAPAWIPTGISQQYVISTYAGGLPVVTPARGTDVSVSPSGVAADIAGNVYFTTQAHSTGPTCVGVFKLGQNGILTRVAGNCRGGYSGDGGPATSAQLSPTGNIALDSAGNLFVADGPRIRRVSPDGIIATVAAVVGLAVDVAVDGSGNLFIADPFSGHILEVSSDGITHTVAGNGATCFGPNCPLGDGGPATSARISPRGIAVDGSGNVFIANYWNGRIRKFVFGGVETAFAEVSPDGIITTVAGTGGGGYFGDGGSATSAALWPMSVAVDAADNLFIADDSRIRRVSPDGMITTVAGNGTPDSCGDGAPAISAGLSTASVAVDATGNLFLAANNRIRRVSGDGIITTVAGNGMPGNFSGDGGPATNAGISPRSVAVDAVGNLFIADKGNDQIPGCYDGITNTLSQAARIRRVSPDGIITTAAGGGTAHWGDGGPATSAEIRFPNGLAVDGAGNLFFTTSGVEYEIVGPERVRKVSPDGIITTVAGGGAAFPGDAGPATSAALSEPSGLAVDSTGNVYVAESLNNVVRILRPANHSLLIGAVVDAASQCADPVSPGKIVGIYGVGLGPSGLIQNQASDGEFSAELAGTTVSFNGIAAPNLHTSATQVIAVAPYALTGATAPVTVTYQGEASNSFIVPVAPSAPSLFTFNQTGTGQAAATNTDGRVNAPTSPVKPGGFISLFATGEGQTPPAGVDGRLAARRQRSRCFRCV
jgi:uncharacterized protein (TIGR03437 family)